MTSVKQVALPRPRGSNAKANLGSPDLGLSSLGLPEKSIYSKSSISLVPPIEPSPCEGQLPNEATAYLSLMAGAAIALAVGMTAIVAQPTPPAAPEYEGAFQIRLESATAQLTEAQPASRSIAAPEVFSPDQLLLLQSPRLLYPVLAKTPGLDYETLTHNLKLTVNADDRLEVHYRDTDAQRLQLVLRQLAQAYLHYSQECEADSCRGVAFIQEKAPIVEAEIASLQAQMQQLDQQNGSRGYCRPNAALRGAID